MTLYLKNKLKSKRTGSMVQVVEHLPDKYEALTSKHSTKKRKNKSLGEKIKMKISFLFFLVLGFELRAYTLSYSLHQPYFCEGFF
jgi:hypothetical protein